MAQYLKCAAATEVDNDAADERVRNAVRDIIEEVASGGLDAVRRLSGRFDKYEATSFLLSQSDIDSIVATLDVDTKADIAFAQEQIRNFAEVQRSALKDVEVETHPGIFLGHRNIPVSSAACYVPGGRYPLVASAHMGIVTAKVAGVKRVVALTPPIDGKPHPAIITAAAMAGADEIHLIGGAHALAAAAYGTEELAPVDMIVGPGNAYVAEAKRQLVGRVGIDLFAGPTEVLVIADDNADAETIAVDLLGQAEHGYDSSAILITTSRALGLQVIEEVARQLETLETAAVAGTAWRDHGKIILVADAAEAVVEADKLASEHVQVLADDLGYYHDHLTQYGALFLGEMTCVAYGDKVIGTNHTLPTRGAARYTGGLWVGKFLKTCTYQRIDSAASSVMIGEYGSRLCMLENFAGHKRQNDLRVEKFGKGSRSLWRKSSVSQAENPI
jgi:sulfopropanediol 3-dehydrogenase